VTTTELNAAITALEATIEDAVEASNPMTTAGDLVVGGATTPVNVALASAGATASASHNNGTAGNAIDGTTVSVWNPQFDGTNGWLTVDLGSAKAITSWSFYNGTSPNSWNDVRIESSADNSSWTERGSTTSAPDGENGPFVLAGGPFTFRYWRFFCTAGGDGGNWPSLHELRLWSEVASPGAPDRLAAGSNGTVLTVVSGAPAWAALPVANATDTDGLLPWEDKAKLDALEVDTNGTPVNLVKLFGGWYDEAVPSTTTLGPTYTAVEELTILGVVGWAEIVATGAAAGFDIEYKRGVGSWTSIFGGTKPEFAVAANAPTSPTLAFTDIEVGDRLRRRWTGTPATIADVTIQLNTKTRA
jgi:hypothetical protein